MQNDEITPEFEQDVNKINEEVEEETQDTSDQSDESHTDEKDWKSEALKYKAILDRNKNKKPEAKTSNSDELDYGQKAFLMSNGVKGTEEVKLVKTIMANTGKSLDDVLESKYFQAELKEMRDNEASANAIPSKGKRAGQVAVDSVDYWLAKGELPPASERELRQKVVNARIGKEKNTNVFSSNPVIR